MAAPRDRQHILIRERPATEDYRAHSRVVKVKKPPPPSSRPAHGAALKAALDLAVTEAVQRRHDAGFEVHGATPGLYVVFESQPGVPLRLPALEAASQGIELVAVTQTARGDPATGVIEKATVFIPEGKVKHFVKRFEEYSDTTPKAKGARRHEAMIDPIASLRLATLRALWTDTDAYPNETEKIWWEVWLRRQDGRELERLTEFAGVKELQIGTRRLAFEGRLVVLVRASPIELASSIDVLDDVAELRRAKETAADFVDLPSGEQAEWTEELLARTTQGGVASPCVCILDTGVNRSHPLLAASLAEPDVHTCDPAWGTHDHHGHGTEMAGLALYGDLAPLLSTSAALHLRHVLESVKILPPVGANPPELYGAVTAEAAARVEVGAPGRRRCFSMALATVDSRDRGQPTSWSAAVDALAAGRSFDPTEQGLVYFEDMEPSRRLFVVCAGNVPPASLEVDHLAGSDSQPVHDPGHAWNALTVGAFTERALIHDPSWSGWQPVAAPGELSPWSTTGVVFESKWPLKPDVVFEGGNLATSAVHGVDFGCVDLELLTTSHQTPSRLFEVTRGTSAATAQAARVAAIVMAEYPSLWPETVRALVVHSAEWTPAMQAHFDRADSKRARARLVARYGFGVPHVEHALRSGRDALTLIAQDTIHPYVDGKMREMHLWSLPWPRQVLEGLDTSARLRVTLSYFIEPNPARRGWRDRYRYASHGLRFELKGPTESDTEFRKRVNQRALDEDESKPTTGADSAEWFLGERARSRGSLHADILETPAADLAARGVIAVYPVGGWWKNQPKRDRSAKGANYALVVSIETPGVDTDIWTPVAQQVGVPIAVTE